MIEADRNELRFERFSNAIVSKLEGGAAILPTSRMRDLGRDGKGHAANRRIFVCSTTTGVDGLHSKAKRDLVKGGLRVDKGPRIYFCASARLTEQAVEALRPEMTDAAPADATLEFLTANQLEACAGKWPGVFEEFYGSDYRELLQAFQAADDVAGLSPGVAGLLLALQTVGHSDSASIREGIYKGAVLSALAKVDGGFTMQELAHAITTELHLSAEIAAPVLASRVAAFEADGLIDRSSGRFLLTGEGTNALEASKVDAATDLIRGKQELRAAIEERLGFILADDHFERVWQEICPRLAHGFQLRGQEIVSFASASLRGDEIASLARERGAIAKLTEDLHEGIRRATTTSELAREIATALGDVFEERDSPAHRWLLGLCAAYVCVCSLGLEDSVGREIAQVVRSTDLVLDTDVVLSLVGESEPAHESVRNVVRRWTKLGGSVFVAPEVVREATHHAWIADRDFAEVQHWLPGTSLERDRYVDNVFVRSFGQLLEEGKARKGQWATFINQFRGSNQRDDTNLWAGLREMGVFPLPNVEDSDPALHEEVVRVVRAVFLGRDGGEGLRATELDKAERDCTLYEKIVLRRRQLTKQGAGHGTVLVTSSRRLLKLEGHMQKSTGGHVAISIAEAVFLLSMLPGTSLGLSSLEAFLFETYPHRFSSPVERTVLRVIHDAADFDIGWSKRHALMEKLRSKVLGNAKASGRSLSNELSASFLDGANAASAAKSILHALREVAATDRREVEVERLTIEVRRLEEEIRRQWKG